MTDQSSPKTFALTVETAGKTALDILAEGTGLSRQRIKDAMNKGAVWWNLKGKTLRLRRATKPLNKGCKIQLFYDEQVLARKPEAAQLIHDAQRYSIWFKPHGMLSQGSQWGDHCSLLRWVEVNGKPKRECFLVHRLDADAAGLMLIAHDQQSAARLSHLFQSRDIRKCYQAWITGLPAIPAGGVTLDYPLDGKSAITRVRTVQTDEATSRTLLDIHIDTGRKHQIRRHLATFGHPIIGDRLYGKAGAEPLQLLAYALSFVCPLSQQSLAVTLPAEKCFANPSRHI